MECPSSSPDQLPRWTRAPFPLARLRQSAASNAPSFPLVRRRRLPFPSLTPKPDFASPPAATARMRRGGATVPRFCTVSLAIFGIMISASVVVDCSKDDSQMRCSRTCVAENCNSVGIRYGKYCGVGWSGCPGEKPCDDLDACCQVHDECVEKKGMTNIRCHEKFKTCIKKVQKSGKVGFSWDCPYQTAVPTMVQGMDMAILLSQFGNSKLEL